MIVVAVIIIAFVYISRRSLINARRVKRKWEREVVLITGGCGALGMALHKEFKLKGVEKVYLVDKECKDESFADSFMRCDLTNSEDTSKLVQAIAPTIIISNCAVFNGAKPFLKTSKLDDYERAINVNFLAHVNLTRLLMAKAKQLHIVNIGSCLGLVGVPYVGDYCASKFALYGFNESLRTELYANGNSNVKTMMVCPFFINDGGMFPPIYNRFPFITRTLTSREVAKAVIDGIENNTEEIWLPWFVRLVPIFRLLPTRVFDLGQFILGTHLAYPVDATSGR